MRQLTLRNKEDRQAMKIFVTGGAGYIGSIRRRTTHRARRVRRRLRQSLSGPRSGRPSGGRLRPRRPGRQGGDRRALAHHKPDGIMHFASHTLVGESWEKPFLYLRDNVVNGLNLLESAVEHDVRRFILSSTANLFDEPERMPIAETERIVPGSPYGESKYIMERYLHWMDRVYGLRYACLRYFNACGATERARRGPRPGDAPHPARAAGGAGPARQDHHLRRRLPHARRHLRARLHPRRRPGPGPHPGPRARSTAAAAPTTSATATASASRRSSRPPAR